MVISETDNSDSSNSAIHLENNTQQILNQIKDTIENKEPIEELIKEFIASISNNKNNNYQATTINHLIDTNNLQPPDNNLNNTNNF
ncbi:hypothetical protein F8M41_015406 [Gigaspora margarita]|uniref:Uncharacterized protein n=1 Tax=Gigaspora margarita TaxID=4874 RepID=A0A8H3ZZD7_GIGMA|nr:hypothetical protein F8M41_015406 [Gigaspora margarita]